MAVLFVVVFAAGIRSAFEWDEFLFARAVENFDAAANSPHMPGYPLFVLATRMVAFAIPDAIHAVQWTGLIAAMAVLVLAFFLGRKLGLDRLRACTAVAVVALLPCFLWFAGVGLSDVAGLLMCGAVLWSILHENRPLCWALLTGVLAAAAVGVRTQSVYLMGPLAIVAVIEWREKTVLRVLSASGAAILTSIGIWVPAILLTGPTRWWEAFLWQLKWVRQEQMNGLALPYAPMSWIVKGWLVRPFGTPWLAGLFWILVLGGAWILWRAGKRRLVLYCLGIGLVSLVVATLSLDLRDGPRYILPSLFFFSFLVAGGVGVSRWYERSMAIGIVVFLVASLVWIAPGLALRRSEPAPVVDVLEQIAASVEPRDVVVFYEEKLWPHVYWILERRGFEIHPIGDLDDWTRDHQEEPRSLVSVHSNRRPTPDEASWKAAWSSPQARAMTRGRYLRCWAVRGETGN
jgi:4-amino-4-deoxy-L-arabinose transferase-like glycosyltransferase